jgi:hypothetical protein
MAEQDANNVAITGGSISGATVSGYIPTSEKAQPNGVATLDAGGKVPSSQIPLQGDLNYQGTWNANTNTPTLVSSTGTKGYYYVVDVAGTTNLDGITDWQIGDWAIYNGTIWQKVDNTDAVSSVNGQTGTVVLTTTNIGEGTNLYYTDARARASISAGTGISYDNSTGVVTNAAPDQTVALTDGTAIDVTGTYPNFTITNTAPDQVVSLTQGGTTTITGTYPNFTISSDDQYDGTVTSVGGTGTVSGISLSGTVTSSGNLTLGGALDLSAPPVIGGTTPNTITGTTINAFTKFVSPDYYAQSILGGNLRTSGGTSLLNWDGGGSGVITVNGGLSANPANKNVSLAPTGTGSVTVNPATAGTIDNMAIGATTPLAGSFTDLSVSGTASFDGSQGTSGQVLTSAGTGNTPTWTTPTTGTVTSVDATGGTGISVSGGPITSSGSLTITNTAPDQTVVLNAGTGISVSGTYPNFTVTNTAPDVPFTYTSTYVPYGQGTTTPDQSADFTYDESVKTLTAPQVNASNGIMVNSATVSANYSIPSGSNAMSAGPITVASGITVTVPSGNAWIIV